MKKVGFIGTGTMAKAIVKGLVSSNFAAELYGYDLNKNGYEILQECGVKLLESANELVELCNFVVLAVKPQNMAEVLQQINPSFEESKVVVSIAAGISEEFVASILGEQMKFVRVMPNTPLLLSCGAIAISRGRKISEEQFNFVKKMFETGGVVCTIEEEQMNDIIAINGSSPAFIYLFAKGFLNFAKKRSIKPEVALQLFCASLVGSAAMLEKGNKSIDSLIADVSSKGGTTIAGLSVLEEFKLTEIVEKTCEKTAARAVELAN